MLNSFSLHRFVLDFFLLHSFLCKEHKNQKGDMTFCVVYTEICVSLRLVTTKSVWKYRTEWNFEKRISDSGPSKHAWILVYSLRIKFYSYPQNPGNLLCKLHDKHCKVNGFLCSLHTSQTCTYCPETKLSTKSKLSEFRFNLLIKSTNFIFYSIKIRLEMAEIAIWLRKTKPNKPNRNQINQIVQNPVSL